MRGPSSLAGAGGNGLRAIAYLQCYFLTKAELSQFEARKRDTRFDGGPTPTSLYSSCIGCINVMLHFVPDRH